jgi:hypothetical protein
VVFFIMFHKVMVAMVAFTLSFAEASACWIEITDNGIADRDMLNTQSIRSFCKNTLARKQRHLLRSHFSRASLHLYIALTYHLITENYHIYVSLA